MTKVGKYELRSRIGSGSSGTVYEAIDWSVAEVEDPLGAPRVAIKFVQASDQARHEIRIARKIDDPVFVRLLDVVEDPTLGLGIVTELVEGRKLDAWCSANKPGPRECARLMRPLAIAISNAHRANLFHRDLGPHNVMGPRNGGQLRIFDLGLGSVRRDGSLEPERHGAFAAPEVFDRLVEPDAELADIYGLAATLFFMLTGEIPNTDTRLPALRALSEREPKLSMIVRRGTEPSRDDRYPTASELAEDLRRYLEHEPLPWVPKTLGDRAREMVRPAAIAASGFLAASLLLIAVGSPSVRAAHTEAANRERLNERWTQQSARITERRVAEIQAAADARVAEAQATADREVAEAERDRDDQIASVVERTDQEIERMASVIAMREAEVDQAEMVLANSTQFFVSHAERLVRRLEEGGTSPRLPQQIIVAQLALDHINRLELVPTDLAEEIEDLSRRHLIASRDRNLDLLYDRNIDPATKNTLQSAYHRFIAAFDAFEHDANGFEAYTHARKCVMILDEMGYPKDEEFYRVCDNLYEATQYLFEQSVIPSYDSFEDQAVARALQQFLGRTNLRTNDEIEENAKALRAEIIESQ